MRISSLHLLMGSLGKHNSNNEVRIKIFKFVIPVLPFISSKQNKSWEVCLDKSCYAWDGKYKKFSDTGKCQSPYFDLEIYDARHAEEVKEFIADAKIRNNYSVPLGMGCATPFCLWKKTSAGRFYDVRLNMEELQICKNQLIFQKNNRSNSEIPFLLPTKPHCI